MTYIKKLVIEGFKSFGKRTEIIFDKGLNVIVGPNGSGKSNIIDAICFVLGRLAMKSLRVESAKNLIFKGSKALASANNAIISMTIDNSQGLLKIENEIPNEVTITRILRSDGSSIYKINNKPKTRNEVLELLSQAGINPYGFNLVLQKEISRFVEMKNEERRKLIEDIAGISVYEERKEKALRELEKTEEKIKEIKAILNEKEHFLRELEAERKQALFYNQIKEQVENLKFSIIAKKHAEKSAEKAKIESALQKELSRKATNEAKQKKIQELKEQIKNKINLIDSHIENLSGVELKELQNSIVEGKAQLAKLEIRRNSLQAQVLSANEKIKNLNEEIELGLKELEELKEKQKQSFKDKKKEKIFSGIDRKIDEAKRRYDYLSKRLGEIENAANQLSLAKERLSFANKNYLAVCDEIAKKQEALNNLRAKIVSIEENIDDKIKALSKKISENDALIKKSEVEIAAFEKEIELATTELNELVNLQICPKCKRVLDDEHKKKLEAEANEKIKDIRSKIKVILLEIDKLKNENSILIKEIERYKKEKEKELENRIINEKIKELRSAIETLIVQKKELSAKLEELNRQIPELEASINARELVETELNEVKARLNTYLLEKEKVKKEMDVDKQLTLEVELKERELENARDVLARTEKEKAKAEENLKSIEAEIQEITKLLEERQSKHDEIYKKFSSLIEEKNSLQQKNSELESQLSSLQGELFVIMSKINELNVNKARVEAELKALDDEINALGKKTKVIRLPIERLEEKLRRAQARLEQIGNVNLLALETYEKIKSEWNEVNAKLEKIIKEKEEILKQIERINKEKKKVFMAIFDKINAQFSENFMKLNWKGGIAKLVLENEKDPFAGGVDILLQVGKGKYFDSTSLSGGEKALTALAFIFAIQQLSPYPFYVFDEIDSDLDKHNSERVANLLKAHIGKHQCIIISHNDATISKADLIYGVSMQDGVSKVISLKL
ncbi:MAG: chromosome segregation SMC family protein [Candidatus Pacearchaeota archaeon]